MLSICSKIDAEVLKTCNGVNRNHCETCHLYSISKGRGLVDPKIVSTPRFQIVGALEPVHFCDSHVGPESEIRAMVRRFRKSGTFVIYPYDRVSDRLSASARRRQRRKTFEQHRASAC